MVIIPVIVEELHVIRPLRILKPIKKLESSVSVSSYVSTGTRPFPIFCPPYHFCPHWIPFNISHNCPEICILIYWSGEIPVFPESSGSVVFAVKILSITKRSAMKARPKPLNIRRLQQQMKMIAHKTIGPYSRPFSFRPLG